MKFTDMRIRKYLKSLQTLVNKKHLMLVRRFERKVLKFAEKMLRNPAGERNKQPILEVLRKYIDHNKDGTLLEISSGVGMHASFFAEHFPKLIFQPSEYETGIFSSIDEYRKHCKTGNVLEPIYIDISKGISGSESKFQEKNLRDCKSSFDFMLNINMMHISPFACSKGLFTNSSKLLKRGGILFTYGPYVVDGVLEPHSNISFDQSLRQRDSSWGIRDIADLNMLASKNSMELIATYNLPSNNKCLVWRTI